jgi:DNA-binding GntR family transcriptional regulator
VSQLSKQDVNEICTLRTPLETLALRLGFAKGANTMCADLKANMNASERISYPAELAQFELEFHEIIVRAAGHERLLASWLNLRSQIRLMLIERVSIDARLRQDTLQGHRELVEAVETGDANRAVAVLDAHLKAQHQWLMKSFTDQQR